MTKQHGQRQIHRLSAAKVRTAGPGLHPDGGNLYLRVEQGKYGLTRSWTFRYAIDGRERYMGLGSLITVSLADARSEALAARQQVRQGIDPIEARKATIAERKLSAIKSMTFAEAARAYLSAHSAGWRSTKHGSQWLKTLEDYAFPIIGRLQVKDIDTTAVLKILEPHWQQKTETMVRVRGRIESVLDWSRARGLRHGENPARWRGHLDHLLAARTKLARVKHFAAMPYAEIAGFMAELRCTAIRRQVTEAHSPRPRPRFKGGRPSVSPALDLPRGGDHGLGGAGVVGSSERLS